MSSAGTSTAPQALATALRSQHSLPVAQNWATQFLASQKSTIPFNSLLATARIRLLNSDITATLSPISPTDLLPTTIEDASSSKEYRLSTGKDGVVVQVLTFEDISRSKWEQVEALEAKARGEEKVGQKIIRVVKEDNDDDDNTRREGDRGTWKLLLQDTSGRKIYGIELRSTPGVGSGMCIGCKLLLTNTLVARGVLLLEPSTVKVLGGKIEEAHKQWVDTRLETLKDEAKRGSDQS